ncbi:hypothetical protein UK89_22845 [Salmonella enterica]|nr:hypothetical protein [Salmonella enterica]
MLPEIRFAQSFGQMDLTVSLNTLRAEVQTAGFNCQYKYASRGLSDCRVQQEGEIRFAQVFRQLS